jgi:hypothetical protein
LDDDLTHVEKAVIERIGGKEPDARAFPIPPLPEDLEKMERAHRDVDAVSWSTDLSGGIQRVCLDHGVMHYGNAKARANAWNLPDPVPVHREPIYTPRVDLVGKKYPTLPDARQFGPSTHAISNRSVVQRYRENGEAGCRCASASPSAFAESHRTCSRFRPIAFGFSAPFQARGGAWVRVGLHTPIRSNFGTQKARLRRKAAQPGARSTGHWSGRCNETTADSHPGDTASM